MSRIVFKCGGAVAVDAAPAIRALAAEHEVCVVHGAGPQISAEMERLGLPVLFVGGRRVTNAAAPVGSGSEGVATRANGAESSPSPGFLRRSPRTKAPPSDRTHAVRTALPGSGESR